MKKYFKNFGFGLLVLFGLILTMGLIFGLPVWIMITMNSLTGGIIGVSYNANWLGGSRSILY